MHHMQRLYLFSLVWGSRLGGPALRGRKKPCSSYSTNIDSPHLYGTAPLPPKRADPRCVRSRAAQLSPLHTMDLGRYGPWRVGDTASIAEHKCAGQAGTNRPEPRLIAASRKRAGCVGVCGGV